MATTNHGPEISILLIDDDHICLSILATILQKMNHHVVAMKNPVDALDVLRMKEKSFDLVITDVHLPEMSGFEILKHVREEFNLPVILMSADTDKDIMLKAYDSGAVFYLMKPIDPNKLSRIWQFVNSPTDERSTNNPLPSVESRPLTTTSPPKSLSQLQGQLMMDVNNNNNINNVYVFGPLNNNSERTKNIQLIYSSNALKRPSVDGKEKKYASVSKRPKLIWTTSLHNLFLEAVKEIGLDKAVPRNILEFMNVPGLKRENVASHLQKYRIFVKRIQEATGTMQFGFPNNLNERPFRSSFVLNEITSFTNNLQQHFQEILASHTQGRIILNDGNMFEQGQSSTQVNNNFHGNTNPIVDTSYIPGDHVQLINPSQESQTPNQNALKHDQPPNIIERDLQESCAEFSFEQETNSRGERVGKDVQTTINNNYVGLRIGANGKLVGPPKNSATIVNDNGDGGNNMANAMNGNNNDKENCGVNPDQVVTYEMNHANNITSLDKNNATTLVDDFFFDINDDVNLYFNTDVDNSVTQLENLFGTSKELPNLHGIDEELRQLGVEFRDQETHGFDYGFESFDAQGDLVDGLLDQEITVDEDISFECYLSQECEQGFNQQNDSNDFTKPN